MIHVADSAKERIANIRASERMGEDYFVRVSVVSGGCSGLSYKLDFDNETKPNDQVFEDNGEKVVTDLKSFLYLFDTTLEFSGGLEGKGFHFNTQTPHASALAARVSQSSSLFLFERLRQIPTGGNARHTCIVAGAFFGVGY